MSSPEEELAALKAMHGDTVLLREGGQPMPMLRGFRFIAAGRPHQMDLLLAPFAHSGYVTRLFFAEQIAGRGANWKQLYVVNRNWWAPSWNHVPASLPWTKMLMAHLGAVT